MNDERSYNFKANDMYKIQINGDYNGYTEVKMK